MLGIKIRGKPEKYAVKVRKVGPPGRQSRYIRLPPDLRRRMNLDNVELFRLEAYPEADVIILTPIRD